VIHYQMTLDEHRAARGGRYVDPDRYREHHRDFRPEMLCLTGDGHAKGTRDRAKVDCPRCLQLLGELRAYIVEGEDRDENAIGICEPWRECVQATGPEDAKEKARTRRYALKRDHVLCKTVEEA